MINIGICDDNQTHREELARLSSKALFRYDDVKFCYYDSGDAVIREIESGDLDCELLFLDIQMPGRNGLRTASYIRDHLIDVDIIFVTVSTEHVFDGYTYRAFSYLLKPLDEQRLTEELDRYMRLKEKGMECLHVQISGIRVPIFLNRVKYFATEGRKLVARQRGEDDIAFYAKMNDLQETLRDEDFLRCHQSYLVNAKYVDAYSRRELEVGGDIIPIARRYVEAVRERFDGQKTGGIGNGVQK